MRVIIQRVNHSSVVVESETVGEIGLGIMALVGFGREDDQSVLSPMAIKMAHMRIFPDDAGRFDRSLLDVQGGVLLVPQFTLYADTRKGRRPDFNGAKPPAEASELFDKFVETVRELGIKQVETGKFGAHMQVSLENDGPVTITLDSEALSA